jgi:starch synthase
MFDELSPQAIYDTVGWAVHSWYNKKDHIALMRKRAMSQYFGWDIAAQKYIAVYEQALEKI